MSYVPFIFRMFFYRNGSVRMTNIKEVPFTDKLS